MNDDANAASAADPVAPAPGLDPVALVQIQSAARWFWWIAGLSLINTIVAITGGNSSFVVGLGITQIADALFADSRVAHLLVIAVVLGFFVLMGVFGKQLKLWAFGLGMAAYIIDGLIYAIAQDWLPVGFHALVLFFMSGGVMKLIEWRRSTGVAA